MRNIKNFALAALAMMSLSCSKDIQTENLLKINLRANGEEATKTALNEDGKSLKWNVGEKIRVYYFLNADDTFKSPNSIQCSAFDSATGVATFDFAAEGAIKNNEIYAISPAGLGMGSAVDSPFASSTASADPESLNGGRTTIPTAQKAVKGSYDPASTPSIGYATSEDGENYDLQFKNVGALVCFTLNTGKVAIKEVKLECTNTNMTSCFRFVFDENGNPKVQKTSNQQAKFATLSGNFENDGKYYFTVMPATYEGLSISFTSVNDETKTFSNEASLIARRNTVTNLGHFAIPEDSWTSTGGQPEEFTVDFKLGKQLSDLVYKGPDTFNEPTTKATGRYDVVDEYSWKGSNTMAIYSKYSDASGNYGYYFESGKLRLGKEPDYLGFPKYEGYKLTKVRLTYAGQVGSNDRKYKICFDSTTAFNSAATVKGGEFKNLKDADLSGGTGNSYMEWSLSETEANTRYYLRINNSSNQISGMTFTYTKVTEE